MSRLKENTIIFGRLGLVVRRSAGKRTDPAVSDSRVSRRVSRLGLVVKRSAGKRTDPGSSPRFGSSLSSQIVVDGHCLVTLPCTFNETVKWPTALPILNAEVILDGDSVALDII